MEEIQIAGHTNREKTLKSLLDSRPNEFDALILTNPHTIFPDWIRAKVNNYLHQVFEDTIFERNTAPNKDHIKQFLEWARFSKKLVVACHQGVSRSSAAAFLIGCQAWGLDKAFTILRPGKHCPNILMVKLGSEILNNPDIWTQYVKWNIEAGKVETPDFSCDIQTDQEFITL